MRIVVRAKHHATKRYKRVHDLAFALGDARLCDSETLPPDILEQWVRIDSIAYIEQTLIVSFTPQKKKAKVSA